MPHRLGWCLAAGPAWLIAWSASATVLTPTILTDELASPGAGCSLREAVLQANRNVVIDPACGDAGEPFPADTIALASGATYVLSITGEDDLGDAGDLDLASLLLLGNGAAVEAAPTLGDRVLHVLVGAQVEVRDLTVRGGHVDAPTGVALGGGILNEGDLTLARVNVLENRVTGGGAAGGGVESIGRLEVTDSVVRGNLATGSSVSGGGIRARAQALLLLRTHVAGNIARGLPGTGAFAGGGGVSAQGLDTRLVDSWFEGNVAEGGSVGPGGLIGIVFGGAVDARGLLTIEGCTFSANVARGGDGDPVAPTGAAHGIGGALVNSGQLIVENSTFSGNVTLPGLGGGFERARRESLGAIFNIGVAALDSVTVTGSSAVGIYNSSGRVTLTNSLVALQASGGDCAGDAMISAGFNLDSDGSCDLTGPGDQPAVAAAAVGLLPLVDNGGFGPTHALSPTSAAFNRGETALERDQRGVPRPQFVRDDVGAVEQDKFAVTDIPSLSRSNLALLASALAFVALALLRRASG